MLAFSYPTTVSWRLAVAVWALAAMALLALWVLSKLAERRQRREIYVIRVLNWRQADSKNPWIINLMNEEIARRGAIITQARLNGNAVKLWLEFVNPDLTLADVLFQLRELGIEAEEAEEE